MRGFPYLIWKDIVDTIFPRFCCVCGRRLTPGEETTCITCLDHLPLTRLKGKRGNVVERLFWDEKICARRANSFIYYEPESPYSHIFFKFKYHNQPELAVAFGRMMAQDLADTNFFDDIDMMVPVPLSKARQKERGYNQSERLAHGVSKIAQLPIEEKAIQRVVDNPTQTQLHTSERTENVKNIFQLTHPELVKGKHILIIDDTITTGSTIRSCAHELVKAGNVNISILSLGISTWHRNLPYPTDIHPGFA